MAANIIQLIANTSPRKQCLEDYSRQEKGFVTRPNHSKIWLVFLPDVLKMRSRHIPAYFIPAFAQHWSSITVAWVGWANVAWSFGVETHKCLQCPGCLTWLLKKMSNNPKINTETNQPEKKQGKLTWNSHASIFFHAAKLYLQGYRFVQDFQC